MFKALYLVALYSEVRSILSCHQRTIALEITQGSYSKFQRVSPLPNKFPLGSWLPSFKMFLISESTRSRSLQLLSQCDLHGLYLLGTMGVDIPQYIPSYAADGQPARNGTSSIHEYPRNVQDSCKYQDE
ncbi:hypothetical protein F4778DRAFT_141369 [Xylariomycetidae sp. FL2044]|nr:hypothetical protein F4778DRAFT_141369 [Xylariomycetidae sp. FL2044]